jgi:predicted PurR-regulated permease PerM
MEPVIAPDTPRRFLLPALFLVALGFLVFRVLGELVEPVAWAAILAYATWPVHVRVRTLLRGRAGWSALAMVVILGAALLVPVSWLAVIAQRELAEFFRNLPGWLEGKPELPGWIARIPFLGDELGFVFEQFEDLQGLVRSYFLPRLSGISGNLLNVLEGAGFLVAKSLFTLFLMFFAYRDGDLLVCEVRRGLILGLGRRGADYLATAELTTRAVFYGIVMTALVQGLVAGLGYWGVGLPSPALLTVVTLVAALVPFGTVVVWVSASLWLVFHGQAVAGIALFLWGALVVSWVDNIVRPVVISRTTHIPFVVVMLGVLGGLSGFGFIGLFLGPVILAIALAVWKEWLHGRQRTTG